MSGTGWEEGKAIGVGRDEMMPKIAHGELKVCKAKRVLTN